MLRLYLEFKLSSATQYFVILSPPVQFWWLIEDDIYSLWYEAMLYLALNQALDLGIAAVNSEAENEIYGFFC